MEQINRSKRIALNTFFMYFRMLFLMFVSFFTARVVLKNLGIEDYGIYNLIAGVVVLFNFIANSSSAATSRYLNFALGENNLEKAKSVYSVSVVIHFFVAFVIIILSEIVGLFLLKHYLVIPENRISAATVIFHLSLLTVALNIINIPNSASIIANEKMSFFAFVSIFEGLMKLLIAYLVSVVSSDKLIIYGILVVCVSLINYLINTVYVKLHFDICKFKLHNDKSIYKELFSFSGWSLLSSVGSTCTNQVLTMILNRFFGVVANAAMGIANQVNNAVYQFISNFQVAFEPQITKSYAANDRTYLLDLIFKTSKFSFFLLWFFVLPLSLNAEFVLKVWLTDVPESSVIFLRIILIYSLIDALIGPLWMVSYAIGNIRNYQIVAFIFSVVTVPVAWGLFVLGFPAYWIVILRVLNNLGFSTWRLFYLKKRMDFPVLRYLSVVFIKCIIVCFVTLFVSCICFYLTDGVTQFLFSCSVTVLVNIIVIYFIGCNLDEKKFLFSFIKRIGKRYIRGGLK